MLRRTMLAFVVLGLFASPGDARAQVELPVKWHFTAKKVSARVYELHMTATIENGWHLFAQDAGTGPVPTSFKFTPDRLMKLSGPVKEIGKLRSGHDAAFGTTVRYYENEVDFVQVVDLVGATGPKVKGTVEFMAKDDHQAHPPTSMSFAIATGGP